MLVLTPNATTVISSLIQGAGLPETGGLRIAGTNDGQQAFTVSPTATPETGDQIVEEGGARVFIEPTVAPVLEETVLDAEVDDAGEVQFLLSVQA
jgi:Fe-S cluster assembly iron-binding protein IscA